MYNTQHRLQQIMAALDNSQHLQLLHMLVWLQQHDFLTQLREYLVLTVPAQVCLDAYMYPCILLITCTTAKCYAA
jgi:hypothetical protein